MTAHPARGLDASVNTSWEAQPPSALFPKNLRELRDDKQSRLKSLPTSNFVQGLQLLVGEGFTSHPVLNGHVPAPADGAPVMGN